MTTRGRKPRPGRIMFVGSGPGDPALLTTRAASVLANAPLVFIDPDVPEPVLALIGKDLPPVFGPVITTMKKSRPRWKLMGTTLPVSNGWRASCRSMRPSSFRRGSVLRVIRP